jgi:hypothetical protein
MITIPCKVKCDHRECTATTEGTLQFEGITRIGSTNVSILNSPFLPEGWIVRVVSGYSSTEVCSWCPEHAEAHQYDGVWL